jgi:hypothetical protein
MLKTVGFPSTRTGDQTIVDGNLVIGTAGKGIDFSANGGDTLTQYDEGTWTPTVTAGSGSITSYSASGTYTRIGRQVTASLSVNITNAGTGTGKAIVSLPIAASSVQCVGSGREANNTGLELQIITNTSAATADVFTYANLTPIATNNVLLLTVTYFV